MAQYLPKFHGVPPHTGIAGTGGVTGGKLIDSSLTTPAAGASDVIGVAGHDAAEGEVVTYYPLPGAVHPLVAGTGGVTKGDAVKTDTSGNVVTATVGTDDAATIIGTALTTATATNVAEILGK